MYIIDIPRQMGKTTYIARLMQTNEKSVCIVPLARMKEIFCSRYGISEKRVFTFQEAIRKKKLIENRFEEVYFDEVDWCLKSIFSNAKLGTHTNNEMLNLWFKEPKPSLKGSKDAR